MIKFYCWYYNNSTREFEGPYIEEYKDIIEAHKKTDVGYGCYISETDENPNDFTRKKNLTKKVDQDE